MGNGITHLHLSGVLDTRDDITYLACSQLVAGYHVHLQHADLVGIIFHSGVEELHLVTLADSSVLYLEVGDDATEGVEHRVEDQCLQRCLVVTLGMRHTVHNSLEHILYALTCLS